MKKNIFINDNGEKVGYISYSSFIGLESEPSKPFIMISELVDNSISSFENEHNNEWPKDEKLEINITFDFRGEETKSKISDEVYYIKNSYIKVTDNGYGMKDYSDPKKGIDECLSDAIQYGNKNNQRSDKNKWGKGMKHCAYFFGQDLKILTSDGNNTAQINKVFTEPDISLDSTYTFNAEIVDTIDKGTEILISNIYALKTFGPAAFDNIVDSLKWRYVRYLRNSKLEINFVLYDESGKDYIRSLNLKDSKDGYFTEPIRDLKSSENEKGEHSAFERIKSTGLEKFLEKCEDEYRKKLAAFTKKQGTEEDHVDLSIFTSAFFSMKSLIYDAIKKDEDECLLVNTIQLDIYNSKERKNSKVPFEYWVLPLRTPEKNAGIRLYEGDRAIRHVSTKDPEVNPWVDYQFASDESNRTNKKFAGQIDLKLAGVEPVKDKSNFKIPDNISQKLKEDIWSVFKAVEIFIIQIAKKDEDISIDNEEIKVKKDWINKSITSLNNKSKHKIEYLEDESDEITSTIRREINEDIWKTQIVLDGTTKNSGHVFLPIINGEKDIIIKIYTKHDLLVGLRKTKKGLKEFVHDLVGFRLNGLINHAIIITNKLNIPENERTQGVYEILKEIGDEYIIDNE